MADLSSQVQDTTKDTASSKEQESPVNLESVPRSGAGVVNDAGEVLDDAGKTVGKIADTDNLQNLVGNTVNQAGDVVSSSGDVLGKTLPIGQGKPEEEEDSHDEEKSEYTTQSKEKKSGGLGSALGSVTGTVGKAVGGATGAVGDTTKGATDTVGDTAKGATDSVGLGLYSVSLTERDREQSITVHNGSLLSPVTEKKYLAFIAWFLNVGYKEIVTRVSAAVESSLSSMSLKTELSYEEYAWLISEIRSKIEGNDNDGPAHKFFNVMMPENLSDEIRILDECGIDNLDSTIDSSLRKLLDETKDFIHSRDLATVLSACLKSAFDLLNQDMSSNFSSEDAISGEKVEKNITLAKLLPSITKEAHAVLNCAPARFLEAIKECKELQALSAIIYASFDNESEINLQN